MQKGVVRKRRPRPLSEYGKQLREKQDLKFQYNLREKQFSNYVKAVLGKKREGDTREAFLQELEKRLDSVVFRMGVAQTRKQARQMVSHRHFMVNGRPLNIASYQVKIGDVITPRKGSVDSILFKHAQLGLKNYEVPSWMKLDKTKMEATIVTLPTMEEIAPTVDIPLIFEFYSR